MRNLYSYVVDHREIVDFLLDRGADINRPVKRNIAKGDRDDTVEVLNKAAALGDIELFDHLVARGADPSRSIALHTATQCEDQVKAAAMVTHLIKKHGFDVESDEGCGGLRDFFSSFPEQEGTPLNFAARYHNTAAAEVLLKNGAASQPLPLLTAVNKKATSILKLLLDAGADPMHGLEAATSCNNLEAAELCLEYGADPVQAEQYQSVRLSDPGIMVDEMSSEMKNLLSEWK
jgi:ankyrin repeat protein